MKRLTFLLVLLLVTGSLTSCSKELVWPSSELGKMIPNIEGAHGEVCLDDSDSLYITLEKITQDQYNEYISACQTNGFTVDIVQNDSSYLAYDKTGHKLELNLHSNGDMSITLHAPISMSDIQWPTTTIANLLPEPHSSFGKIEWSNDSGFVIYLGNTSIDDYNAYIEDVKSMGFIENVNSGDKFYYASNSDEYRVTLKFEGFNTMFVRIDAPSNSNSNESDNGNSETAEPSSATNDSTTEDPNKSENLTIENNRDLANILSLKDPSDPSVAIFATQYKGQTIEFDGCILSMTNHGSYKTRYDILIGSGDYDKNSVLGPNFRLTDVNSTDMKLGSLYPEDILKTGKNVHIVATVKSYNPNTTIFELDIISVAVR